MSEPQIKLQVSLDNPNIESNVPGEQNLREYSKSEQNDDSKAVTNQPAEETSTTDDKSEKSAENTDNNESLTPGEQKSEDKTPGEQESEADTELATQDDFVLTPVMTVTKNEAVFTKGDLKLQKITVTEDISDSTTVTTVTREKVTVSNDDNPEINKEVLSVKQTRTESHGEDKNQPGRKKTRTRIPMLRFRQAVEKVKEERRTLEKQKKPQTPQTPRRSSIPRLKDSKIPPPNIKDSTSHKVENTETSPQIDDEFDKLYDDLVDDQDCNDNLSIASKIEDPVKLENTFEEIIHAYEENKIQPINIEKIRQSKIPLLKRKSDQEMEIPKQTVPFVKHSVKHSISLDSSTQTTSESVTEEHSKIQSVSLNKSPIKTTTVSQWVSEAKSVSKSSEATKSCKTTSTKIEENQNKLTAQDIKQEASTEELKDSKKENENNNSLTEIQSVSQNKQSVSQNMSEIITKSVHKKESVHESTAETFESVKIVNTATTDQNNELNISTTTIKQEVSSEKSNSNKPENENASNINKETVKIATPVFKTLTKKEIKANIEKDVTTRNELRHETKSVNSVDKGNVQTNTIESEISSESTSSSKIEIVQGETIKQVATMKSSEQQETKDINTEDTERLLKEEQQGEEDNIILRAKVKSLLTKIRSRKANTSVSNEKSQEAYKTHDNLTNKENTKISSVSTSLNKTLGSESIRQQYSTEVTKESNIKEQENKEIEINKAEELKEEDNPIIRGKVGRILRRIDSIETNTLSPKKDPGNDIPKYQSVMSKIALFERSESTETPPKPRVRCIAQIPGRKNEDSNEINDGSNKNGPKIVQEVLKATPASVIKEKSIIKDNSKDTENSKLHFGDYNNVPTAPIINSTPPKPTPRDNGHTFDIQIVDTQMKTNKWSNSGMVKEEVVTRPTTYQRVYSLDKRLSSDSSPPPSFQEIHFNPSIIKPAEGRSQNNKLNKNNTKESNENKENKHETRRLNYDWKINHNVTNTAKDKSFYSDYSKETKTGFYSRNNRAEITSSLVKEEVNEQIKGNDKVILEETIESDVFDKKLRKDGQLRIHAYRNNETEMKQKSKSLAELDLGDAVTGKVKSLVGRMNSYDRFDSTKRELIDIKGKSRKISVSEKIALFERKVIPAKFERIEPLKIGSKGAIMKLSDEDCARIIEDLSNAKKHGTLDQSLMQYLEFRDGNKMPIIGLGTAQLHPKIARHVVKAAIDLGYRTIDTAYIYGNEKEVGEGIRDKIQDGTVKREDLFVISKLWSTFHRQDLVEKACRASLEAMGLDFFDQYLIHNPMSFKEGKDPIPRIASVIQFSEHDYLEAWYGIEDLVRAGLVRSGGVSNFNSVQVDRVVEKGKIKPVVNQVECHPYLSQHRLDEFCQVRNVKLCCYGVLGSKGTPDYLRNPVPPVIDDPLVRVMAAGLGVSSAALLISYQISQGRGVIVKSSSAAHLWDNLQALTLTPSPADLSALHALNRNKRIYTFKGMGDTHKNYPFNIQF